MGIKSFTAFMKKHYHGLLVPVNLAKWKFVVVDGNGLCHYLYFETNCDWRLGGEYPQFYSNVKACFEQMRAAGVEPIVIFDGSHDQGKTETVLRRKGEKNRAMMKLHETGYINRGTSVSPILMLQTFMDVLQDMKIEFHIAPSEGDRQVAAVANARGCPVLSSDSDFFMYELNHGFILFEHFNTAKPCLVYYSDNFAAYFGLRDPKLRLFIPALHGNDFIKPRADFRVGMKFKNTIERVSNYSSSEECLAKEFDGIVLQNYRAAERQYCSPQLAAYENQKATYISMYSLPEWTFDSFLRGTFHPHLLDVLQHNVCTLGIVVEDIHQQSAWVCSRPIRQHVYGFIGCVGEVNEHVREDHKPGIVKSSVAVKFTSLPARLNDFQDKDMKDLVLCVLGCADAARNLQQFQELEEKWKLPLATVRYWYQNSELVTQDLMKALLLCFLHCSGVQLFPLQVPMGTKTNLLALHVFGQWQCVYYDAMILNNITKNPFITTSPSLLFSGQAAMSFACHIQYLKVTEKLFQIMFNFVMYQEK